MSSVKNTGKLQRIAAAAAPFCDWVADHEGCIDQLYEELSRIVDERGLPDPEVKARLASLSATLKPLLGAGLESRLKFGSLRTLKRQMQRIRKQIRVNILQNLERAQGNYVRPHLAHWCECMVKWYRCKGRKILMPHIAQSKSGIFEFAQKCHVHSSKSATAISELQHRLEILQETGTFKPWTVGRSLAWLASIGSAAGVVASRWSFIADWFPWISGK